MRCPTVSCSTPFSSLGTQSTTLVASHSLTFLCGGGGGGHWCVTASACHVGGSKEPCSWESLVAGLYSEAVGRGGRVGGLNWWVGGVVGLGGWVRLDNNTRKQTERVQVAKLQFPEKLGFCCGHALPDGLMLHCLFLPWYTKQSTGRIPFTHFWGGAIGASPPEPPPPTPPHPPTL